MTAQTYRYRMQGVTPEEFQEHVGVTPTSTPGIPAVFCDMTYDDSFATDGHAFMLERGWTLAEIAPPAPSALMVANAKSANLTSASSAFPVASGWTDVAGLSVSIATFGGSKFAIDLRAGVSAILVAGEVRALINGGSFSDAVIGAAIPLPVLVGGQIACALSQDISATGSRTTYTVRVQARGLGALASVTLAAYTSSIRVIEYAGS